MDVDALLDQHTDIAPFTKKVLTFLEVFNLSFVDTILQTVIWVGWWNILAYWAWPWVEDYYLLRDLAYLFLGCSLKFVAVLYFPEEETPLRVVREWTEAVPPDFSWSRKIQSFAVWFLHFISFLFAWVGAWNIIDLYVYNCGYCWQRELFYVTFPMPVLFVLHQVLSKESIYWMLTYGSPFRRVSYTQDTALLSKKSEPGIVYT